MKNNWDYAKLSQSAKEAGGPEQLLDSIRDAGKSDGRIEGAGVGALFGAALVCLGASLVKRHRQRKIEADLAKEQLLAQINKNNERAAFALTDLDHTDEEQEDA